MEHEDGYTELKLAALEAENATLRRAVGLAFTVAQASAMYDLDHNDLDLTSDQLTQCLEAANDD